MTHKLENNYITEVLPQEWEFWAPRQAPQPEGPASEGGVPRAFSFEGQWGLSAGAPQEWGKQRLHHSWRAHTSFHVHWDPAQSSDFIGAWARPTCGYWRVSWRGGGWLWLSLCKDTCGEGPREYWLAWALPEVTILAPRSGPTLQPAGSSAGRPQAKQPALVGGRHSPTHQQTGSLKLYWAHSHL